jgi:peptidoglycan/LPS O-acetylase OafA/YrhL
MSGTRLQYAAVSSLASLAAGIAIVLVLCSRCGLNEAIAATILIAVLAFPLTIGVIVIGGMLGYYLKGRAIIGALVLCILAIGALCVTQVIPNYTWGTGTFEYQRQCRIDL